MRVPCEYHFAVDGHEYATDRPVSPLELNCNVLVDQPFWYGMWVRAGNPVRVVDKRARDFARALAEPNMRE